MGRTPVRAVCRPRPMALLSWNRGHQQALHLASSSERCHLLPLGWTSSWS
jgi:hypothetical protein